MKHSSIKESPSLPSRCKVKDVEHIAHMKTEECFLKIRGVEHKFLGEDFFVFTSGSSIKPENNKIPNKESIELEELEILIRKRRRPPLMGGISKPFKAPKNKIPKYTSMHMEAKEN